MLKKKIIRQRKLFEIFFLIIELKKKKKKEKEKEYL